MVGVNEALVATLSLPPLHSKDDMPDRVDDLLLMAGSLLTAVEAGTRLGRTKTQMIAALEKAWETV